MSKGDAYYIQQDDTLAQEKDLDYKSLINLV